jgi:hypothetical protein
VNILARHCEPIGRANARSIERSNPSPATERKAGLLRRKSSSKESRFKQGAHKGRPYVISIFYRGDPHRRRSRVPGAVQRSSRCAADPGPTSRLGPRLCSASRRKSGALRFVRGTINLTLAEMGATLVVALLRRPASSPFHPSGSGEARRGACNDGWRVLIPGFVFSPVTVVVIY